MNTTQVILAPVTGEGDSFNNEPQFIRVRAPNTASLYISYPERTNANSSFDLEGLDRLVDNSTVLLGINSLISRKTKRAAVSAVKWNSHLSPINPTNNEFLFLIPSLNSEWQSVVITPSESLRTPSSIAQAVSLAFSGNAVWAAAGGSVLPDPTSEGSTFTLDTIFPAAFDPNCSAVKYGLSLWNFHTSGYDRTSAVAALTTEWVMGPINCLPTAYIDIHSSILNQYTKNPNASSRSGSSDLIHRVYLKPYVYNWSAAFAGSTPTTPPNNVDQLYPQYVDDVITTPSWFTMNPDQSLTNIDISLKDMYGRNLYIDRKQIGSYTVNTSGIGFDITLTLEI